MLAGAGLIVADQWVRRQPSRPAFVDQDRGPRRGKRRGERRGHRRSAATEWAAWSSAHERRETIAERQNALRLGPELRLLGQQNLIEKPVPLGGRAFTRAAAEAPDWPAPVMRRAVIRGRELDDYAGAVRDLTELIESDPDSAEAYLQRDPAQLPWAARRRAGGQRLRSVFAAGPGQPSWRPDAHNLTARLRGELAERGWDEDQPDEA